MSSPAMLWLDPRFGASGDMVLGALLGLGAPLDRVRAGLDLLGLDGWSLDLEPTTRASLSAHRAVVNAEQQDHHRSWTSIDALIADRPLPDRVAAGARRTFARLGEVEAGIHGVPIDEVHFHEVGALDAVVDIVGAWLALDALGAGEVTVGPIGIGHGTVEAAHGTLPIPAPATAELICGAAVQPIDVAAETVTPTGAALLTTMASGWGPMPPGRLVAVARGAGGRDPGRYPNVLTGYLLGTVDADTATEAIAVPTGHGPAVRSTAVLVSTNLDDVTPETIGRTIDRCLQTGADDAWATPMVMKKSRPAVELSVLCGTDVFEAVQAVLFTETATLGTRSRLVAKDAMPRRFERVTVRGHDIGIKVGPHGAKPEYDDLVAAADRLAMPVRQLAAEALAAHAAQRPK